MVKELIRDSSTGKLQRDSVTGKLQHKAYPIGCEFCTTTPEKLTLTISGLVDCACFHIDTSGQGGELRAYKVVGLAANLNGTSWVLDNIPTEDPCIWQALYFPNYFGTLYAYYDVVCTGFAYEYPIINLYLHVNKTASNSLIISISHQITLEFFEESVFINSYVYATWNGSAWVGKVATISDCLAVSDLANIFTCGDDYQGEACGDGMVTIVEGALPQAYTQMRMPTGDASVQWSPGTNNYDKVDDWPGIPDDDATYNYTNVGGNSDYLNFPNFNVPAGATITNMQIVSRYKKVNAGGAPDVRALLRVGGSTYYSSGHNLVIGGYLTFTDTWSVNPKTGLAWTIDDVNGVGSNPLQQLGYQCLTYQKTVRCTQSYIKVNFTHTY